MTYYRVTLRVKNEVGVLARIATRLRKFEVNIRSLDVAPIDGKEIFSDIHMVISTPRLNVRTVMKKLESLIPVTNIYYEKLE
ncbi:ACT domain-containing protein [Candidatus Peregrinibacteria bacterium]|nr:ACT domain-containing protein [Candidatus Peregrinibacteria bacterium]